MAARDPLGAQPAALENAVLLDRLVGIGRAARRVDTAWRQRRPQELLIEAYQQQKRPVDQSFHWRTVSQIRCGSCGIISRSSASRTAPVEPGMQNTSVPPIIPAAARESMAA